MRWTALKWNLTIPASGVGTMVLLQATIYEAPMAVQARDISVATVL